MIQYIYIMFQLGIREEAIRAVEEGRLVNFITQKLYLFKSVKVGVTDFDELLKATKSILKGKRLSYGVLVKQLLKRKIVKGDALVSAFLLRAVSEGYLKKARKGKLVYYSIVDEKEK